MLDDHEFQRVSSLLNKGTEGNVRERMFGPLLHEYELIAGFRETNPNAIYHHVLSMYGPPCAKCGKPLRTPRAKNVWVLHGSSRRLKLAPGGLGNNAFTEWSLGRHLATGVASSNPRCTNHFESCAFSENLSDKKHLDGIRE